MTAFSTALSALQTSQRALQVIGNNISNMSTPGYHRQDVQLGPSQNTGSSAGQGVGVQEIRRARDEVLEVALTEHIFEAEKTATKLQGLRQIETLFPVDAESLGDRVEGLFNEMAELTNQPDSTTGRWKVIHKASSLTDEFNTFANRLNEVRAGYTPKLRSIVNQINSYGSSIADLNAEIIRQTVRGVESHDLADQRDGLINRLAELVDVNVTWKADGSATVLAGDAPLVQGEIAQELDLQMSAGGATEILIKDTDQTVTVSSGQLGGLLELLGTTVPGIQEQINELAGSLIQSIDSVHAQGVGVDGIFGQLRGQRPVEDVNAALLETDTAFPITAGSLFVAITEEASGDRRITEIAVDPETQSLQDLATQLSGIDNLQAAVNAEAGTLTIFAESGYGFDFSGGYETTPDRTDFNGSAAVQMNGIYNGIQNDELQFTIQGSGTVGSTDGLEVLVTDQNGVRVTTLDIGSGYQPGSALDVVNGVQIQFGAGTVNDGDQIASPLVSNSDNSGVLTALGLNTMFVGNDAATISVSAELEERPSRLASSRTGDAGDGTNLSLLIGLREQLAMRSGQQTYSEFFTQLVVDVGSEVQESERLEETQKLLGQQLESEWESIAGVDPNEELVKMIQFQRMFENAAHVIRAQQEMHDTLLNVVGPL